MINKLKNTPVRELIRVLEKKMDSNTEDGKGVKEFIATLTAGVLSFIFTILKIPYHLALS